MSKQFYDSCIFFFFFQAEDGIRDYKVTGVQTCALPIFPGLDWGVDEKALTAKLAVLAGALLLSACGSREDALHKALAQRRSGVFMLPEEIGRASCRERG